jgi:hypothetical protein
MHPGALDVALAERTHAVGIETRPARRGRRAFGACACWRSIRVIEMISGSSIVPSTCEWLDRICSISVEPARGRPTMKIGSAHRVPCPARSAKNSRVYTAARGASAR